MPSLYCSESSRSALQSPKGKPLNLDDIDIDGWALEATSTPSLDSARGASINQRNYAVSPTNLSRSSPLRDNINTPTTNENYGPQLEYPTLTPRVLAPPAPIISPSLNAALGRVAHSDEVSSVVPEFVTAEQYVESQQHAGWQQPPRRGDLLQDKSSNAMKALKERRQTRPATAR